MCEPLKEEGEGKNGGKRGGGREFKGMEGPGG
jgi:hypothetical protein